MNLKQKHTISDSVSLADRQVAVKEVHGFKNCNEMKSKFKEMNIFR